MRFHPKFFPHLKSKAVRTALLKTSESSKCETDLDVDIPAKTP